jgi:hypothetical protein
MFFLFRPIDPGTERGEITAKTDVTATNVTL